MWCFSQKFKGGCLLVAILAALLLGSINGCSKKDILGQNSKGSLRGRVTDRDNSYVALAGVRLTLVSREVTTDINGNYEFTDIPVGKQQFYAYKAGYAPYNTTVQIKEDDSGDPTANQLSFSMTHE